MSNIKILIVALFCGLLVLNACETTDKGEPTFNKSSATGNIVSQSDKHKSSLFKENQNIVNTKKSSQSEAIPVIKTHIEQEQSEQLHGNDNDVSTQNKKSETLKKVNKSVKKSNRVINSNDSENNYIPYVLIGLLILVVAIFYVRKGK